MNDPSKVESILLVALEQRTDEARSAYLDDVCRGNPALREKVDQLLAAHPKAVEFPEQIASPADEKTAVYVPSTEQSSYFVAGRYKLLEKIGEGGMGEVWVAEQTAPVRRKVALKLIKAGMDSKSVLARFEAERQALAVMDHPNIAKVLDGGLTEQGRPFFVMEYFKGVPITEYCDAARLSIQERLGLFTLVCQAVQHAHQKGIIHRDLKPSNILVALYDDKPVPKVIDFGLAKAMHQSLTERTLHTAHDIVLGTPLYMSPEQALLNNLDVDTRSDIYSLGVLLYELLTGTTPLEIKRFKEAAWDEVKRIIREEDPPLPSTRLSSISTLPSLAAGRQLEPNGLTKLVRGELDWIVMKALEKNRNRRYDTANGFAADVRRFLAGEPVQAAPPSATYRWRKFAQKNRVMLATAGAFVGLLLLAVAVTSWLAVRAIRAETRTEQKRGEAEKNAKAAENNANLYRNSVFTIAQAQVDAVIQSRYLQTDLDLMEAKTDPRLGLVRLAKSLNRQNNKSSTQLPNTAGGMITHSMDLDTLPKYQRLREFITAAVLISGQAFVPLLPPISHDGQAVLAHSLSSDNQRLLTFGADDTARLWNVKTSQLIAVLRRGDERVVDWGFSPDGKLVFTDDAASVARIWNGITGEYRASTDARAGRYVPPTGRDNPTNADKDVQSSLRESVAIAGQRLLTRRVATKLDKTGTTRRLNWDNGAELWDLDGRLVTQWDGTDRNIETFNFVGDGRWVTTSAGSTVIVFSADDGKEVARLEHPGTETSQAVTVSPSGKWLETITDEPGNEEPAAYRLHFWDTKTWRRHPVATKARSAGEFLTDDYLRAAEFGDSFGGQPLFILKVGREVPLSEFNAYDCRVRIDGESVRVLASVYALSGNTKVDLIDGLTGTRIPPPASTPFHPDLAKFCLNSRFVLSPLGDTLVDLHVNKSIYLEGDGDSVWTEVSGAGFLKISHTGWHSIEIRNVPYDSPLSQFPDLLEKWTKVAVRGELNAEDEFVKWKESEWEEKRQELAAIPPPIKDFQFPGYVANDKLHWLRAEYNEATEATEKRRLAQELLRRAEESGDKIESVRWQAVLAK